jgi:chromosome segregation ATPase
MALRELHIMRKESNIKSKVQDKAVSKEDLENFLFATDRYIDCLEEENEELHWIVDDQDKSNNELTNWVVKSVDRAKKFRAEVDELKEDNDYLTEEVEELEDQAGEMYKHIRSLEEALEEANAKLTANKVVADRQDYLNSFVDKEVVMSDTEISILRTRKKLTFIAFKEMLKKNPNVKNHVAAKELGVTLETIIKLKCMLAA